MIVSAAEEECIQINGFNISLSVSYSASQVNV